MVRARAVQQARFGGAAPCNAQMTLRQLRRYCRFGEGEKVFLLGAIEHLRLSARACDRVLRLARTIADLEGRAEVTAAHLAEAIQYRSFDRPQRRLG